MRARSKRCKCACAAIASESARHRITSSKESGQEEVIGPLSKRITGRLSASGGLPRRVRKACVRGYAGSQSPGRQPLPRGRRHGYSASAMNSS
jgi:hypothetical protein